MKAARVGFFFLLAILIASSSFYRQPRLFHAQSGQADGSSCCGPAEPHEVDFAYYSLRDGFTSTLMLVSASPQAFNFTIGVHSRSGQTLLSPSMAIQPQEKLSVDLGAQLVGLGADVTTDFSEGSVAVYFKGNPPCWPGN